MSKEFGYVRYNSIRNKPYSKHSYMFISFKGDQTKHSCDELRVKIDTMESKLIAAETENIRLKESIDILVEEMSNYKTSKGN